MPRDDLSIDFVKKMAPQGEVLDSSMILDDWINRVQNLPEEIRFIQDEIADKDRQYNDCIKTIEERDNRIQKFIKTHGSHETNPREEGLRVTIRENFAKADQLAAEKLALTEKMKAIMDKHLRQLDVQIKMLYDRNEPGFTDPDELPSLLRPTTNHQPTPTGRTPLTVNTNIPATHTQTHSSATPSAVRVANPTIRSAQSHLHGSASAPATPAASMILSRQTREASAGPGSGVPKRGPRVNSGLGNNVPTTSSGLARHSSLGPGTPKGHHQTATGAQRAGSAGPRASTKSATSAGPGRKSGLPLSTAGRKKTTPATWGPGGTHKSGLSRVKRAAKASPSSTVDSELSDASSGSGDEGSSRVGTPGAGRGGSQNSNNRAGGGSPAGGAGAGNGGHGGGGGNGAGSDSGPISQSSVKKERRSTGGGANDDDEDMADIEDDEAGDDRKYCICQNVSFGDMVACDNDKCPYEWFHWSCVGLKSEPNGTWYCPVCTDMMKKAPLNKGK